MALDIQTVTSGITGLFSNTHLIQAPDGVIAIDPPMLLSDAHRAAEAVDSLGRLAAIVYTHPHPDHVNGATAMLRGRDLPVYATRDTDRVSREIDTPKREFWSAIYPTDYPPVTTFANVLVADGDTLDIARLEFTVTEVGAGECETAAVWRCGSDAFVGDLAYAGVHPWLAEGRSARWLQQLEDVAPQLVGMRLHIGHGPSGGAELLIEQARYIRAFQAAVRELAAGAGSLGDAATAQLAARMTSVWPEAALVDLVGMSAPAVAAELAALTAA